MQNAARLRSVTQVSGSLLVDIPTGWEPQRNLVVRALRVAFSDFSAAPWQGFEKSERGPSNSSLFQPLAAVVVVAVQVLFRTEKEKPVHNVYWFFFFGAEEDLNRAAARSAVSNQPGGLLLSPRFPTCRNVYREADCLLSFLLYTAVSL